MESEDVDLDLNGIFPEPDRPPTPETTVCTYVRAVERLKEEKEGEGWKEVEVRLVGTHTLWGHYLWNAARAFATYLDREENVELYKGKNVLELGAGAGLPGLVMAINGARRTVLTDYPDEALLDNLTHNVARNISASKRKRVGAEVFVEGYIWGRPVDRLLELVAPEKYDLVILSDLVFNHSQHDALLKTCELTLRTDTDTRQPGIAVPTVLVFYTHHRPHLASRDLEFFSKARERGWVCKEVVTERYPPMFPDDPGDEDVRATVHGWSLTRR
ncbi:uncharacterized protein FOMMEDRAFT_18656 [Fomitiporia mediterranea MF3/22]|uniref:uncharacterized protein n=1 Tax=Fomitiporia mediterranea (strain MF3/22) TaxID=694068 RepID=UPI0004408063|nr:uncharacterized protein FOMMEDRAFT_18656 [Fomitiporia mediterranea MF3/22]EJD04967.1 hypothetical protein FOMMEDRAFT_18656 [Fomitiporia mediterranea MF3/22]